MNREEDRVLHGLNEESYNQLWNEFHGLLMRLAPHSRRTPEEVSTRLDILRAVAPALPLEPRLRRRPAEALRNRRDSFDKIFDLLSPERRMTANRKAIRHVECPGLARLEPVAATRRRGDWRRSLAAAQVPAAGRQRAQHRRDQHHHRVPAARASRASASAGAEIRTSPDVGVIRLRLPTPTASDVRCGPQSRTQPTGLK